MKEINNSPPPPPTSAQNLTLSGFSGIFSIFLTIRFSILFSYSFNKIHRLYMFSYHLCLDAQNGCTHTAKPNLPAKKKGGFKQGLI